MKPNIVLPEPAEHAAARQRIEQFKPWFKQSEEKWWGKFVPYDVRHVHDPYWRTRFWSIHAAHDKRGFWKVVWYLWLASTVSGPLWAISLAYKARQENMSIYRQRMKNETEHWIHETYGR